MWKGGGFAVFSVISNVTGVGYNKGLLGNRPQRELFGSPNEARALR
jgi:hypothetical protein